MELTYADRLNNAREAFRAARARFEAAEAAWETGLGEREPMKEAETYFRSADKALRELIAEGPGAAASTRYVRFEARPMPHGKVEIHDNLYAETLEALYEAEFGADVVAVLNAFADYTDMNDDDLLGLLPAFEAETRYNLRRWVDSLRALGWIRAPRPATFAVTV